MSLVALAAASLNCATCQPPEGFLKPSEVEEGLQRPQQSYEGNEPTPPRPLLNKRDTKDLFKGMKKVKYQPEQKAVAPTELRLSQEAAYTDLRGTDTPIKNQFDLGYCTAFASIAVLENIAKQQSKTLDLSEYQHFQDYRQYSMYSAAQAAAKLAIVPEAAWPYKQNPVSNWQSQRLAKAKSWTELTSFDQMLAKVSEGKPVVLGTTTNSSWNSPLNGMIKTSGNAGGGHAIAIVGFNKSAATPYFIIKNSWGTRWGDKGYAYVPFKYCNTYDCYFISYSDTVLSGSVPSTPTPVPTVTVKPTVKPTTKPSTRPTVIPINPPKPGQTPDPKCRWVNHFQVCD